MINWKRGSGSQRLRHQLTLRGELLSVLANRDPLLHIFQLKLFHPGIFRISGNGVAQFGGEFLQFEETQFIQGRHRHSLNPEARL